MRILSLFIIIITQLLLSVSTYAVGEIRESDLNVRNINITDTGKQNEVLDRFISPVREFFFSAGSYGGTGISNAFIQTAFQIKNFFISIAVIFLLISIIKLLFGVGDEERAKKWKANILWITIGIFIMQIGFGIWNTLFLRESTATIGTMLGWRMWVNIFSPIVGLLQLLASLGFLAMAVYAFFTIVTGGGDEEKLKKGKNMIIYGLVGFLLIRLPRAFISAIYGAPDCKESEYLWTSDCAIKNQDLNATIGVIGSVFNYLNTFLGVLCVILVIYAGWLVLVSGGDEEKLKKAKNIILYIIIGLMLLVSSHAIFRFFIMNG